MTSCLLPSTRKGTFNFLLSCPCVCVCVCHLSALTGGRRGNGPFPSPLVLCGDQREESATSLLHFPPDSCITTWRSDSVCCPPWPPCQTPLPQPLTPSPISPLKVPKAARLNVWFLFIHVMFLLLPATTHIPRSWITLRIYCTSSKNKNTHT